LILLNIDNDYLRTINFSELKVGDAKLRFDGSGYTLMQKDELWFGFNYIDKASIEEFYYPARIAYGDCILSGLGMGILASLVLKNPNVKSVTIYEKYKDIINLNKIISFVDLNQINIINKPMEEIKSQDNVKCDCLFLDHYEFETNEYKLNNSKEISNAVNHDKLWVWNLNN
jgi:hypothetical protein